MDIHRIIKIIMILLVSSRGYSQNLSLTPYVIANDTISAMLKSYVFSEDEGRYLNRRISIDVDKYDSLAYVIVSINNEKGLFLSRNLSDRPYGYVQYGSHILILESGMKEYVSSANDMPCLTIPVKDVIPQVDGLEEWHFVINRNQKKAYFVDHVKAW